MASHRAPFDSQTLEPSKGELHGEVSRNIHRDVDAFERNKEGEVISEIDEIQIEPEYLHGFKLLIVILSLMLAMFLVALDMSIVATAIPRITHDFHSLSQVGWYGSALFLTLASFVSFWGKAFKYFPIKWAFLTSIVVFELGSLICAVAPNSPTLVAGRAIQGIGGSGMASGIYRIISFIVAPPRVPIFIGLLGAVLSVSSVLGPFLGGVLTEKVSWRWCFYINLPIGGFCIVVLAIFYHTPAHVKPAPSTWKERLLMFDFPGILILSASLVCFLLALEWGGVSKPWSSPDVIGTLASWIVLLILWVFVEWKQGEQALVVPRILKRRVIAVCSAFVFFSNFASLARTYNLPIYFQAIDGVSPLESGIRIMPTVLSLSLSTILGSAAVGRVGYFQPFLIAGSILATIGAGLIYMFDIGTSVATIVGYQIVAGIGVGLALQVPVIVAQGTSRPEDVSIAMSNIFFFQFVGGAFGVSAAQSILNNRLIANLSIHAPNVSVERVLSVGAYGLRSAFSGADLAGILQSYMTGLKAAWCLTIACAGATFFISLFAGWTTIKPKAEADTGKKSKDSVV